jgi:hypothetical protein
MPKRALVGCLPFFICFSVAILAGFSRKATFLSG